ncbi:MAG: ATP-binding protein [Acidobacteriota bacterium]|nr:ATP-binding protein [Acidobacteriota bacterium]
MTTHSEEESLEKRVLVLAPTGRDATLTCQMLGQAGVQATECGDDARLFREIRSGAGTVVLAEEALQATTLHGLLDLLREQEPWSDLPLIIFARAGGTSENALEALAPLNNATILERPVRISTLVSSVQAALRARQRQYEVRGLLRRLAEADRRKDEFLAMLGHELRNPLAAIRNATWALGQAGSRDSAAARQRDLIERQVRHLVRMVDDLLDVSRVTLGKISLHRQIVDLREVAERCLSELAIGALAASRDLRLTLHLEQVIVEADPVRLEQVVCNLLQNAVKYTPRGGSLEIGVGSEGGRAIVRVRDTGVGIPPEMLTRIFEPFTQVESSRQRSEGGLGLGLPLVRSLVQLHGGDVEAKSDGPGTGSEFIIRLPLEEIGHDSCQEGAVPAAPLNVQPSGLPLSVLVVEDNLDGRESLSGLLELWGYRVELAADGPQGVEKALAMVPDVALVDIGLPGYDGNEVARRIRQSFESNRMALIAMTGYGQPEDRLRALESGFDTYLVKPVDPGNLSRLLTEASQRRTVRAAAPAPSRVRLQSSEPAAERWRGGSFQERRI